MTTSSKRIRIAELVSPNLATRDAASAFLARLESIPENAIVVDFEGIRSITRSFAHEYMSRKKSIGKVIQETNVPTTVRRMMEIVTMPPKRKKLVDADSIPVTVL